MTRVIFAVLVGLMLAGCDRDNDIRLQGWVEAELIFVSPDEQGRVEQENVREGDHVKKGDLLFTLDADLQQADVAVKEAAVTSADQSFVRAKQLLTTSSGTQKTYDDADAALRQAKANLDWSKTRLARRRGISPADGTIQEVYFRQGETVPPGRAVMSLLPPGNLKLRFFAPETQLPAIKYGATVNVSCDGCAPGPDRESELHRRQRRIHAAGDLQPGRARQARVPDRGTARSAGKIPRRPARYCHAAERGIVVNTPDIVIDVHGLTKRFDGRAVVRNLSMQVKRGTIYGFLGPNGSGKTTTIRMLCGLLTPDEGEGTCLGYDIRTGTDMIKRQVGYMTQHFSLYQDLSVRENLEFIGRIYGLTQPVAAARAAIERLGLQGREDQIAGELSGGWKQRLALGACTLPSPQLLLLDEPTAGVDPKARRDFWNEIHALAGEGLTVLVSTHYMDEAERCHEIAYIAYGELMVHGTVDQVIEASHLTTYVVSTEDGENLTKLNDELTGKAGIDMVAPFGNSLHVSGRDAKKLAAAIKPYESRKGLDWKPSHPSLEDVFIDLMGRARDNFQ